MGDRLGCASRSSAADVAASPPAFWWLNTGTVYALGLVLIAPVYIGFAVVDGPRSVLVVERSVATVIAVEIVADVHFRH